MKNLRLPALFAVLWMFLGSCSHAPSRSPSSIEPVNEDEILFHDETDKCTDENSNDKLLTREQIAVVNTVMASHSHRLNHALWHATRNGWSDLTKEEKHAIQTLSPEWGKNAPLCPPPGPDMPSGPHDSGYDPAGEEFFLMHHRMISTLQAALLKKNLKCIGGWRELPSADDKLYPVPNGAADDSSKTKETGDMLEAWFNVFTDPVFLRQHSLSQVGYLLEFTLHNNMHMRWAKSPDKGDDFSPVDGKAFTAASVLAPSKYDAPKYNWLGNPYSAHVNPIFWKLHGLVDGILKKWLAENGYGEIAADCAGRDKCYQWQSQWVGGEEMSSMGKSRAMPAGRSIDPSGAVDKILHKAGFRNIKFEKSVNAKTRGLPTAGKPIDLNDPEQFVEKYGPCSP